MATTDTIVALALVAAIVAAVGSWKAARNSDKAANEACSTAMLRVRLEGPPGLLSHDAVEISVSIRNDSPHRGSGPQLAGGVPPEEARAHIWGPWKFRADGRDDTGRTVAAQQLAVGEWTRYGLTPTSPPVWSASTMDDWRRDYANEPVRLSITTSSQGSEWTVPLEVPVTIEDAS